MKVHNIGAKFSSLPESRKIQAGVLCSSFLSICLVVLLRVPFLMPGTIRVSGTHKFFRSNEFLHFFRTKFYLLYLVQCSTGIQGVSIDILERSGLFPPCPFSHLYFSYSVVYTYIFTEESDTAVSLGKKEYQTSDVGNFSL